MFSCEFCKTSKNTFFTEHLWATASAIWLALVKKSLLEFNLFSIIVTLFLMNLLYFIICKCMDTLSFQKWYCSIYSLLGQKIDIIIAAGWFIVIPALCFQYLNFSFSAQSLETKETRPKSCFKKLIIQICCDFCWIYLFV